jgi:hypothetical protein
MLLKLSIIKARTVRRDILVAVAMALGIACGASSDIPREEWLHRLNAAIHSSVSSRETNRQNSQRVEQALEQNPLERMKRIQVNNVLGPSTPCGAHPKCKELGFSADDVYYTVGDGNEKEVGKRPMIIVGFDHEGFVIRVWNLRIQ